MEIIRTNKKKAEERKKKKEEEKRKEQESAEAFQRTKNLSTKSYSTEHF